MDLSPLINFFTQQVFTYLPGAVYSAQLIARIAWGILKQIGFNAESFGKLLAQANIKLPENLAKELVTTAAKGVEVLAEWIKDHLHLPEIQRAAGELIASQVVEVGEAFDQALKEPEKRQAVAKKAEDSLKEAGKITSAYPVDLATVLLDPAKRAELAAMLQKELDVHPIQKQIAEMYSLIKDSEQSIIGRVDATQEQIARNHSGIVNSKQTVQVIPPERK